jgi:two-component sensor histidine kinase/CHASE1-domain containing sensor protein
VKLRDAEHFDRLQVQALRSIDHSFDNYSAMLRSMAAVVASSGTPDTGRLQRFLPVAGVPGAYPGLRSVGLIWWLGAGAAPSARADAAAALPKTVTAHPLTGESAVLFNYPVHKTTPNNYGSDLYAEPARHGAMASARDADAARLSPSLKSLSDPSTGEAHLLLFLPVNQADPAAPGGRRFLGWVFSSFSNRGLFQSTLGDLGYLNEISVHVYDGAPSPTNLLYASPMGQDGRGELMKVVLHQVAGRTWQVQFAAAPKFESWPLSTTVVPIVAAGLAITLSLTFASWLQAFGLQRARIAEAEAKAARDRSELLMNEVNHRVANSLQLVSTLVSMQAEQVNEPAARDALTETRGRIMAVARVHQRLYASGEVSKVALKPYLDSLIQALAQTARRGVTLRLVSEDVSILTDKAVSLGIVAAELITNAVKYAYPEGPGEIRVIVTAEGGLASMAVEDDGVGVVSPGPASTGLGMRIVKAMTTGLKGELQVEPRAPGHRVSLTFPLR